MKRYKLAQAIIDPDSLGKEYIFGERFDNLLKFNSFKLYQNPVVGKHLLF